MEVGTVSDYSDVFGREPEAWRGPLGALRLTLADDAASAQISRARAECEELVRVLNQMEPETVVVHAPTPKPIRVRLMRKTVIPYPEGRKIIFPAGTEGTIVVTGLSFGKRLGGTFTADAPVDGLDRFWATIGELDPNHLEPIE